MSGMQGQKTLYDTVYTPMQGMYSKTLTYPINKQKIFPRDKVWYLLYMPTYHPTQGAEPIISLNFIELFCVINEQDGLFGFKGIQKSQDGLTAAERSEAYETIDILSIMEIHLIDKSPSHFQKPRGVLRIIHEVYCTPELIKLNSHKIDLGKKIERSKKN